MDSGQHAYGQKPSILRRFFGFLIMVAIVLGVSFGVRVFAFEPFNVPSGSMENTIMTGDTVFAEKISYLVGEPKAGQIVTFSDPQIPSRVLIKRCIATEGQTIDMANGVLYVDGVAQEEPYVLGETYPLKTLSNVEISYPYTVPAGTIWVMGDNRENSADSRYFGPINVSAVFGQGVLVYWPLDHFGLLK